MSGARVKPSGTGHSKPRRPLLARTWCIWLAPVSGVLLFGIVLLGSLLGGTHVDKALAGALVLGSTVAWLDVRALSIEITSLLIIFLLVATRLLTFADAMAGASFSSIWLVWVGGVAGAAFDACRLSDWVVAKTMAGARLELTGQLALFPLLCRIGA